VPSLQRAVAPAGAVGAAIGRGTQLPWLFTYESAPQPGAGTWFATRGCVVDVAAIAARSTDSKYASCAGENVGGAVGATVVGATVVGATVVTATVVVAPVVVLAVNVVSTATAELAFDVSGDVVTV
jgi:hypothetical protein